MRTIFSVLIASNDEIGGDEFDYGLGPHIWDGLDAGGGGSDSGNGGTAFGPGGIHYIELGNAGDTEEILYTGFIADGVGPDLILGGEGPDIINGNP